MLKDMINTRSGPKMTILVEPREGDKPVRRRRGRGKKWLEGSSTQNQGTIKKFFNKLVIPKECLDQRILKNQKEGGKRKRVVEDYGSMEQMTEPPRTKSRPDTTCGDQRPDVMTVPGGTFVENGAKSFCGREQTDRLEMGALDLGMELIERRKEVSRGRTNGPRKL